MRKYISYILLFSLVISLALAGCSNDSNKISMETGNNNNEIDEKDEEIERLKNIINSKEEEISKLKSELQFLKERISSKDSQLQRLGEETDYYRKFIDSILTKMTEDELIEIAERELWYTLGVFVGTKEQSKGDYIDIPKNGKVEVNDSNFMITLAERQTMDKIISPQCYPDVYKKVRIHNFNEHLKINNYSNYEIQPASGVIVDAYSYFFEDVPEGTIIDIEITEELKKRLGLETKLIKLSVK